MWIALAMINLPLTAALLPILPIFLWYSHAKGSSVSKASQALRTKEQILADAITETLRFASAMKLLSGMRAVLYKQLTSQGKMCGAATRYQVLLPPLPFPPSHHTSSAFGCVRPSLWVLMPLPPSRAPSPSPAAAPRADRPRRPPARRDVEARHHPRRHVSTVKVLPTSTLVAPQLATTRGRPR